MRRFAILALLLTAVLVSVPALAQDVISTLIGGGPNGIPAIDSNLYNPYGIAVDSTGNFYIASYNQHRVFKVATTGTLTVLAGTGVNGFSGDGVVGGAASAMLNHPFAVAVDATGNVYIADQSNCAVRKVDTANTITTIAGIGASCGFSGDGGKGVSAQLYNPEGVAVDTLGNLYIGDVSNCRVRKLVLGSNNISTFAGNGTCGYTGDGGSATSAELNAASGLSTDATGNVYIADTNNFVIREVTKSNGKINTIAGNHTYGFLGDGAAATAAEMTYVYGISVNSTGTTVTIADQSNQRIRQFTVGGNITTVAGTGVAGYTGDGAAATAATFNVPVGLAVSSAGTVYVADDNNYVIRKFTVGGNISTIAGNHTYNLETLVSGIPPTGAILQYPYGVFADSASNVFVNEANQFVARELVASSQLLNVFAGNGTQGYTGDNGKATSAEMTYNYGVAKDKLGNVYIADTNNCIVRVVNSAGNISTYAGIPDQCGFTGDGGAATAAKLYYPYGVAVDSKNNVYITDTYNHVVREVTSGVITTIAGLPGHAGFAGDGGPAVAGQLYYPTATAVDGSGNVYIADQDNCRIRKVTVLTGVITTAAGSGVCAFTGDGLATESGLNIPQGIAADTNGNLFIADTGDQRVRWVSPNGIMTTIAGNGTAGFKGDGGVATSGEMYNPTGIALDPAGNIIVGDQYNLRVRSITPFAALNSSAASLTFSLTSVGSTSSPQTVTLSALGPVTITNISTTGTFSEADNCPASMATGTTCVMYVYFTPTAAGVQNGSITINHNGFFNPVTTITLSGTGSAISLAGAPVNFGNQLVKTTSAAKSVTVKNNGTTAITMGTITLNETTDFTITANTCPASGSNLAGGASCSVSLTFGPKSTGAKKGTVIINDNDPTSPQLIGVSGNGTSNVSLSPASVTFPTTAVGTTSAATKVTLTNNTGVSLTLANPAVTLTGHFGNATSTTCTNSLVIPSGGSCFVNVTFKPTAVGFTLGSLSIADTDVTSPQTVSLQGTGTGIKFTPASVNFGNVNKGTQVSTTVTITNVGLTPVGFAGALITGANSADFSDNYANAAPCGNTATNPLQPGTTCVITVFFLPTKTAAESANYKLFDNSTGSPQILSLKGTGQ